MPDAIHPNSRRPLAHRIRNGLAVLVSLGVLAGLPPAASAQDIRLEGTRAHFSWQPAPGDVEFYEVWVSRSSQSGAYALEQTVTGANSALLTAAIGEVLRVRVRAGNDKSFGPMSAPSQLVRFGQPPQLPVVGSPGVVTGRAGGSDSGNVYYAEPETGTTWRYPRTEEGEAPAQIGQEADDRWNLVASGDFDGDGNEDLFWHHENGATRIWYLDGDTHQEELSDPCPGPEWIVELTSDLDGNGQDDVVWRDPAGPVQAWMRAGVQFGSFFFPPMPADRFELLTGGDFDGDGFDDLLWRDLASAATSIWFLAGDAENGVYARVSDSAHRATLWEVAETRDEDGDGNEDIRWRQAASPDVVEWWLMDGAVVRTQ